MPYAVSHLLIVIILLELFRDYYVKNKRTFPLHYVLIGGIAGLLPDIDIAAYYVLSFFGFTIEQVHRTYTHTLFLPLIFLVLGLVLHGVKSKKLGEHHLKLRNIFFVIAFGTFMHLVLDAFLSGTIMPFYPISAYSFGIYLLNVFPYPWRDNLLPTIDAALLVLWLVSLELRHKISSFI